MTVTLGGEAAQLIHVGRMLHTDAMSAIVFPGERAVFVVDFITPGRLPYVDYFTAFAARPATDPEGPSRTSRNTAIT